MTVSARFVRDLPCEHGDIQHKLWQLSEPVNAGWGEEGKTTEYVVTSASNMVFLDEPETYIFPSDSDGEITEWSEMDGSYRGGLDHEQAIRGAGWEIDHD